MPRNIFCLFLIAFLIKINIAQKLSTKKHRLLVPHPLYNVSSKQTKALKFHSKILQTVYSDSFSKIFITQLYI